MFVIASGRISKPKRTHTKKVRASQYSKSEKKEKHGIKRITIAKISTLWWLCERVSAASARAFNANLDHFTWIRCLGISRKRENLFIFIAFNCAIHHVLLYTEDVFLRTTCNFRFNFKTFVLLCDTIQIATIIHLKNWGKIERMSRGKKTHTFQFNSKSESLSLIQLKYHRGAFFLLENFSFYSTLNAIWIEFVGLNLKTLTQ